MSSLNFSKLAGTPRGEAFEGLIRLMGERLGMVVEWTGRGPDGGRDSRFVETQIGPIKARPVRWLVSCKDNSDSNHAVTERDVGGVLDKVKQHDCDGFLLATTTTASTGLKEMLDKLDISAGGPILTKVWDRFEITNMLLSNPFSDLLMQFFPEHQRGQAIARDNSAKLAYLSGKDSELGSAIKSMARKSAWGRWYAAQHLVNSGAPIGLQHLYQLAASAVMDEIINGNLEVRGRRPDPKQLGYEPIDRTYWRSSCLHCVADPVSLWKIQLIPKGGVEFDRDKTIVRVDDATAAQRTSLLDYDSLLVDSHQFESLWPQTDELADTKRCECLREARQRGLDKDEIQRLS